jgi:hypothetical protein
MRCSICLAAIVVCLFLVVGSTPALPPGHEVELAGGVALPFESDHRDVYGPEAAFTAGYAGTLLHTRKQLFLELGYFRAAGDEYTLDGTFELPRSSYWYAPFSVGIRGDLSSPKTSGRVLLGFGLQYAPVFWRGPFGETRDDAAFGALGELREDLPLSSGMRLWFRQRLSLLTSVDFDTSVRTLNLSSGHFGMGLSFGPIAAGREP